jgi:hypothetical protein
LLLPSQTHLTEKNLLLASKAELPRELRGTALDHLSDCSICRQRLRELGTLQQEIRVLRKERYLNHTTPVLTTLDHYGARSKRPIWLQMTAGLVAASLLVSLIFFGPGLVPSLRASELLSRAAAEQVNEAHPAHVYSIRAGATSCILGAELSRVDAQKPFCDALVRLLKSADWNVEDPLSARSFEKWRRTLKKRRDRVSSDKDSWLVRTEAAEGELRVASLKLRSNDYRPVKADLEFQHAGVLQIAEVELPPAMPNVAHLVSKYPTNSSVVSSIDPLTLSEAAAWNGLHRVHADSGWEATVTRRSDIVEVDGIAEDEKRRAELIAALQPIPHVRLNIHTLADVKAADEYFLPQRTVAGDSHPLAEAWLKQKFPDGSDRNAYQNRIREASHLILGRAHILEQIMRSAHSLEHCAACRSEMLPVLQNQRRLLSGELSNLANELQPYLDNSGNVVPAKAVASMTYAHAQLLDGALRNLFALSSEHVHDAESERAKVERLLFR